MTRWTERTGQLREELAAIAEPDLLWWAFAGGVAAAERWGDRSQYLRSNAEPGADTFMGVRTPAPADPIADAIARARAAQTALRELDGLLPNQPLAVAVQRAVTNGVPNGVSLLAPAALDAAAFVIGDACVVAPLDDPRLADTLAAVARGAPAPRRAGTPFVCVTLGEEPLAAARHGHRRAWVDGCGPGSTLRARRRDVDVSTCHLGSSTATATRA
ncbi:MAG: hypothetical protein KIT31_21600 [Deltaproteobacteria bacterium]|nr:hypothetical protein [Deltaproteobacteria bacterium]